MRSFHIRNMVSGLMLAAMCGCSSTPPEVLVALDRGVEALANAYAGQQERGRLAAKAWSWSEGARVRAAIEAKTIASTDEEGRIAIADVMKMMNLQREEMERIADGLREWTESSTAVDAEHSDALSLMSEVREYLGLEPVFTAEQSRELRGEIPALIDENGGGN